MIRYGKKIYAKKLKETSLTYCIKITETIQQ